MRTGEPVPASSAGVNQDHDSLVYAGRLSAGQDSVCLCGGFVMYHAHFPGPRTVGDGSGADIVVVKNVTSGVSYKVRPCDGSRSRRRSLNLFTCPDPGLKGFCCDVLGRKPLRRFMRRPRRSKLLHRTSSRLLHGVRAWGKGCSSVRLSSCC